ncbi:hypothetical protein [Roseibium sp. MMSF_3412]|uniref:hypothetical protein n=1 Tax=Roseibium sp. MMSF_3412 TaxID=3046712 RepID=UPI00273F4B0F|nr:hypothetical protein [Roseibium sp. MMSF_3412]
MIEKLIEHWLDSIGERGYQAAFLQMLVGEGHTVIHSTRHMPIEFGKDVITVGPDGVPCCFQLKGNPGSRLTQSQFREIRPQLTELIEQRITYPGVPGTPHRCYLVTNGEVEEEVQRTIDDINQDLEFRGFHTNTRLKILSRGQLLRWAIAHSGNFWPDDFSVHENLIRMYNVDGKDQPDLALISKSLDRILAISKKRSSTKKPAFVRSMLAASLFVSFAIRNYVSSSNHNAVVAAWVSLLAAYACALDRYGYKLVGDSLRAYETARIAMFSSIIDLLEEVRERIENLEAGSEDEKKDLNQVYLQGGSISDRILWNARALKTLSLLSLLRIDEKQDVPSVCLREEQKRTISLLTKHGVTRLEIWGEAAIPQVFANVVAWRMRDATNQPNLEFLAIIQWITAQNLKFEGGYAPSPYHNLEDCIRSQLIGVLGSSSKNLASEVQSKSSYFAEGLLHCFVRTNLKSRAKSVWPDMTRLMHNSFVPAQKWEYGLWRADNGKNLSKQLPHRYEWSKLQRDASETMTPNIPDQLRDDPVVLLAFIIFYPQRGLPEVLRFLHYRFCRTWFLPFPQPD